MPSTKVIVGVIIVVLLCLSSIMAYVSTRPKPPPVNVEPADLPVSIARTTKTTKKPKRTPSPTTAPPTPAPTQGPMVSSNQTIVYPDPYGGLLPPPPPAILVPAVPAMPTFVMVPGASMPGMVGRRRDEVTTYIMTRYPRLVVRVIPTGSPVTYDVRKDRITVSYDPYTNRVVTARVG